jgi:hypothetical protein
MMVEVFKTNVKARKHSTVLANELTKQFPEIKINFDLNDRDKILRVEGKYIIPDKIISLLNSNGYLCKVLDY